MKDTKLKKVRKEETEKEENEDGEDSSVDVKVEAIEEEREDEKSDDTSSKRVVKAKDSKSSVKTEVKRESKEVKEESKEVKEESKKDLQSAGARLMKEIGQEYGASLRVPGHKWSSPVPDVCLTEECILGEITRIRQRMRRIGTRSIGHPFDPPSRMTVSS